MSFMKKRGDSSAEEPSLRTTRGQIGGETTFTSYAHPQPHFTVSHTHPDQRSTIQERNSSIVPFRDVPFWEICLTVSNFAFLHYLSAFYQASRYTCLSRRCEITPIPRAPIWHLGSLCIMAKQTRPSKRRKNMARPETFLLGLRKKLGVRTLLEVKRQALHKALAATKGDKALAAALLGIGKTTLYRSLAE